MSHPSWPFEQPRQGLGLGAGAALGVLVGLVGPVLLGLLAWGAESVLPPAGSEPVITLAVLAVLAIPVVLLVAGCILMVWDRLRGWGVACLTASGVWLLSSAGVCTVFLFGALASYDTAAMMAW